MLLTVVTALSLAGTPSTPQTWFGGEEAVPEGPVLTSGPEVTTLTLSGTPGLPLLPADAGIFQEKAASDTLTVDLTEAALGASSRTYTWSGTPEGFAEVGLDAQLSFAYSGAYGNPSGSLRAYAPGPTPGLTLNEECTAQIAWTDLGVPAGHLVTHFEADSVDVAVLDAAYLTDNAVRVRVRHDGSGISSNPLTASLPLTPTAWTTYSGTGPQAVDASAQPAETVVDLVVGYDVSRSVTAGILQSYVDNLTVTAFWSSAVAATTPEAVTELKLSGVPGSFISDFTGREVSNEVFLDASDTLFVQVNESPVDEQEVNTVDTLSARITEAQQSLVSSAVTDTLRVYMPTETGSVVGSGGAVTPVTGSDTLTVTLTETAEVLIAVDVTDDLEVTVTEDDPSTLDQLTLELKTASDTLTIDLLESFTLGQQQGLVEHNVADELTLTLVEFATFSNTGKVKSIDLIHRPKKTELWPTNDS